MTDIGRKISDALSITVEHRGSLIKENYVYYCSRIIKFNHRVTHLNLIIMRFKVNKIVQEKIDRISAFAICFYRSSGSLNCYGMRRSFEISRFYRQPLFHNNKLDS